MTERPVLSPGPDLCPDISGIYAIVPEEVTRVSEPINYLPPSPESPYPGDALYMYRGTEDFPPGDYIPLSPNFLYQDKRQG